MTTSDSNRKWEIVEDALRSYPLSPAPDGMKTGVLRRVRSLTPVPGFSFPWLEAAIGVMAATVITVIAYLWEGLPPAAILQGEHTIRLFFSHPMYRPILIAVVFGVCLLAVCFILTGYLFRFSSGRRSSRIHKH
jgi:hypothetical protein